MHNFTYQVIVEMTNYRRKLLVFKERFFDYHTFVVEAETHDKASALALCKMELMNRMLRLGKNQPKVVSVTQTR